MNGKYRTIVADPPWRYQKDTSMGAHPGASETPTPRATVEAMPRRTAHALYGALTASIEAKMPVTAREAQIYDEEAITARQTAAGLRHAQRLGWIAFDGTYWWTDTAQQIKYALEERYLRETDSGGGR